MRRFDLKFFSEDRIQANALSVQNTFIYKHSWFLHNQSLYSQSVFGGGGGGGGWGGRRDVTGCTSHQAVLPGVRPGRRLHNTENSKSESHAGCVIVFICAV